MAASCSTQLTVARGGGEGGIVRIRACLGALLVVGALVPGFVQPSANAQVTGVDAPAPLVHVWQVNLNQLTRNWRGFIERMALAEYVPDIILVQELCNCDYIDSDSNNDLNQFTAELNATFPSTYSFRHGDPGGAGVGTSTFAVFWKNTRFNIQNERRWDSFPTGSSCSGSRRQVAVSLYDTAEQKNLVAASVHYPPPLSESCLRSALGKTDVELETLQPVKPLSIIGGDLNQRPDKDGELPTNGLEADPDCWYRQWSSPHANTSPLGSSCTGFISDKYVDAVWAYPGLGGHLNPALPAFCNQYTYRNDVGLPLTTDDTTNSCTDVDGNAGVLDQGRIDYIWIGWETSLGNTVKPTDTGSLSTVAYASADLGMSLDDLTNPTMYSDHRAVEALVRYPVNETT